MSTKKRWNRWETWLTLLAVGIGGVLTLVAGLHIYMTTTATPIHPVVADVSAVAQQVPDSRWTDAANRARQIMREGLAQQNLPGVSVAVGVDDAIVWSEGFGWADLDKRVPVTPTHRFRIGSASNVLTSAAVGLLLEQGALKLDDEIQVYVPEFAKKPWPVTVRHVLAQVSGINANVDGDEGPLYSRHCARPVEGLPPYSTRALSFEPDTRYHFTSYGGILMSAAIEAATHQSFLKFMRNAVFDPLHMDDTSADQGADPGPNQVSSYFPRYAAEPRYGPDPMRDLDLSCFFGAGVFVSTPSDLVRFGLAMNNDTLLKSATVQMLQTAQRLRSGAETGYGLGWDRETVTLAGQPAVVLGHEGDSLGGMVASLMVVRERGMVVAITSNISYADTSALAAKIAEAFLLLDRRHAK